MRKLVIADRQWSRYASRFAETLEPSWQVVSTPDGEQDLIASLTGAHALVSLAMPCEALHAAFGLGVFVFPGAGLLDAEPSHYPRGCAVVNVFEHGAAVAEYVLAAILMHVTGIARRAVSFRAGSWVGSGRSGGVTHDEAFGKTLGLVGYGTIGQAIAERAMAFGMRVLAICDSPPVAGPKPHFLGKPGDLSMLLRESDFVAIACPLTAATRGLLGEAELRCMRPMAFLINVSRAEIVEERPLYEALRTGQLGGAALDVWYQYPENAQEVLHGSALPFHELENVIVTPHMAGWTSGTVERRVARIAENLRRFERGQVLERVVFVGTG